MRFASLDEIVIANYYDEEKEEWKDKVCTVEDVLFSVCEEYTEYEAIPHKVDKHEQKIIHCKDCIHFKEKSDFVKNICTLACGLVNVIDPDKCFCSYAVRRTNEEND